MPAYVTFSKSGRTIYFNGKSLKRSIHGGIAGNYYELGSGDEYWVSGVKKTGINRHWAGSGKFHFDVNVVGEFLKHIGEEVVDTKRYEICANIQPTDPRDFVEIENEKF